MKLNFTQSQIAQTLGHVIALVVGYAVVKQGAHMSAQDAAEIAGVASVIVGPLAAKLVSVEVNTDVDAITEQVMTALAESQSSRRSVLGTPAEAVEVQSAQSRGVVPPPPPNAS